MMQFLLRSKNQYINFGQIMSQKRLKSVIFIVFTLILNYIYSVLNI